MKCPNCKTEIKKWGYKKSIKCNECTKTYIANSYYGELFLAIIVWWFLGAIAIFIGFGVFDSSLASVVLESIVMLWAIFWLLPNTITYKEL